MKVGILSMQRIKNYGSFLQSYSLKKNIEALGHEVQFVDYLVEKSVNEKKEQRKGTSFLEIMSGIRRKLGIKTKSERFFYKRKEFKKRYDNEFFDMLGLTKEKNYTPELDTLVIGSDEVFNCLQTNKEVGFSMQLFGADNRAKRLITYAASCGNTTIERLKEYGVDRKVGNLLKRFDAFSVRDRNTEHVVKELSGRDCEIHVDPVFIYDYPEIKNIKPKENNYIVLYAYTNRIKQNEEKEIVKFARKNGKKIICIGEYQNFCDEYISANPFELLAYIKYADYVITDTFHGTVFSIKLNKNFATIVRESSNNSYGNKEKLEFLLEKFGLIERCVESINSIEEILLRPIDFSSVNEIIAEEKEKAICYLKANL